MAKGVDTGSSPNRQVAREGFIVQPTPDGGASSGTAGPVIQSNWEAMRNSGMSAEAATARLHNLSSSVTPSGSPPPWWLNGQQGNSDSHGAVMTAGIPSEVAAPQEDSGGPSLVQQAIGSIWDPS